MQRNYVLKVLWETIATPFTYKAVAFLKRIESEEKFHWPRLLQEDVITLSVEQLNWLLDGYDVWTQPHKMLRLLHVS